MKRLLLVGWLVGLAAVRTVVSEDPGAVPATVADPPIVIVTLTDGTKVEGTLKAEDDRQITVEEELAGGTITQTRSIARTNIVAITPLSKQAFSARAAELAWQNLQRYQLNPQTSYALSYYEGVIDKVLRPFLEKYPDSPHADEVGQRLTRWEEEREQVARGQAKFQGRWMPAKEAGPLIAKEQAHQAIQQARSQLQRGRYEPALERLRSVQTADARTLTQQIYDQWSQALQTERGQLQQGIAKTQQQIAAATAKQNQLESAARQRPSGFGAGGSSWVGPSQNDIFALNKARKDLAAATSELQLLEAQLQTVQRQLEKVASSARKTAQAAPPPTEAGSRPVFPDTQASVTREDWGNPTLLHQIADFARAYWPALAIAGALGLWYLTRRMLR